MNEETIPNKAWKKADFQFEGCLGKGRFGSVYKAIEKRSKKLVALKEIKKNLIFKHDFEHQLRREVEIQCRLNHPNIIKLYGIFQDEKTVWLVLEMAEGGSLYEFIEKNGPLSSEQLRPIAFQLLAAILYLEKRNVIHRDIKLENILLDKNSSPMLCDFGWAVHKVDGLRKSFCGTVLYLPPEMILRKPYDQKVDIWSLGVLFYELLAMRPPFYSDEKLTTEQVCNLIKTKSLDDIGIDEKITDPRLNDLIRKVVLQ